MMNVDMVKNCQLPIEEVFMRLSLKNGRGNGTILVEGKRGFEVAILEATVTLRQMHPSSQTG